MEPIKIPLVDGYHLKSLVQGSYMFLEAEEMSSGRTFSLKLDSDSVAQVTNGLFEDIQALHQGLIEAASKVHPGVEIAIRPGGQIKYTAILSAGSIKKEYGFSLDLEEKAVEPNVQLEKKVDALMNEINRLKEEHVSLEDKIHQLKIENEKAHLLILELKKDKAENMQQLDKVRADNERRCDELAHKLQRLETRDQQKEVKEQKLEYISLNTSHHFNPSSMNASHFDFLDNNRTISKKGNSNFVCLEFNQQIPNQGLYKYRIKFTGNNGNLWFLGITTTIGKESWHSNEFNYRFSGADGRICTNDISFAKDALVDGPYSQSENIIITMQVDMNRGTLTFLDDNTIVNSIGFLKNKAYYAYISCKNGGDSFTLV